MEFLLHILAGAAVGFAIGLTGVGGGSLMTPLLLVFGYPAPVAIGTDLLYAAITKAGGAVSHHRQRNVEWKIVLLLAAGSIPVSVLLHVFFLDAAFQESPEFESLLTFSLGIMLIVTAIILIFRDKVRMNALEERPEFFMQPIHSHRSAVTWVMGLLLGACVTLSSVGAGAFGAAILMTIYTQLSAVRIIGTDIAHAVPLTFFAGLGYMLSGYVDFVLLFSLLVGSLPAIHWGSKVSSRVPDKVLQRLLTLILLCLGGYYSFY
ncbi:MAG: sulfite exporter TauE/SafE family protein [Gammaproteobacteria bacterium]|nr:sulfite exporter TauE/SafE family protein [Gammaproteobacteria bacterium]MDD9958615.1 sulfite exporter TauE/SafE family protein [Gammaproteobacteria bacterium]